MSTSPTGSWVYFQIPGDDHNRIVSELRNTITSVYGPTYGSGLEHTGIDLWYRCPAPEHPEDINAHLPNGVTKQVSYSNLPPTP